MADPPKKLTFGFAKVVKKSNLVAPVAVSKEKPSNVQFIECMESNTIKLKEGEDQNESKEPLVIPMLGPRKSSTLLPNGKSIAEIAEDFSDVGSDKPKQEIKQEIPDDNMPADSLEAMAAREILKEGADALQERPESTLESLPASDNVDSEKLKKESTLEDYENIPVTQFGLAMLRGMGWKPDEGIGKNSKLVPVAAPVLRPKGMGLGADKVQLAAAAAAANASIKKGDEELKMVKGAYVKVIVGRNQGRYAQVEGFSDDDGRILVKMAIGGNVDYVFESTVCLVTKSDYSKNSKLLNAPKVEEVKKEESRGTSTKREKKSVSPEERPRQKSPMTSRVSKKSHSGSNQLKDFSSKRDTSLSPKPKIKKEKKYSRSSSESPDRYEKKARHKGHNNSPPPSRERSRRNSPNESLRRQQGSSSQRKRSVSMSPERSRRTKSSKSKRSRSRSYSQPRDERSHRHSRYSESDSDSKTHKKKKKHRERKRTPSSPSSDSTSQSRSRSPRNRKKVKKSRRGHSRSPSSRRRR